MATRQEARDAKAEARSTLNRLGAIISSIGVEEADRGFRISAGLASGIEKIPQPLQVNGVHVRLFEARFGQLS